MLHGSNPDLLSSSGCIIPIFWLGVYELCVFFSLWISRWVSAISSCWNGFPQSLNMLMSHSIPNLVQQCFLSSWADSEKSSSSFQFDFSVVIRLSNFYLLCFNRGRDANSTIKTVDTILEESQKGIEKSKWWVANRASQI